MIIAEEIGIKSNDMEKIQMIFRNYSNVEQVILFGSRAKGNYKTYSDIDIALIGTDLNLTVQQKIENDLDDLLLPYKFDVSIFHKIGNQDLIAHINRVGKVIFTKLFPHKE